MQDRVRRLNDAPFRDDGRYVLYWAQMNRRVDSNHALAYATDLANQRNLPLLFYEGLTCTYPYASDRLHTFVLEGVPHTARRLERLGIGYVFHLRKKRSDPNDVLYRLADQAGAMVTDDYPVFIARCHNSRVPAKLKIPYFAVDSSCIVPMRHFEKREYGAYTIRPKIKKVLVDHLKPAPPIRVKRRFDVRLPKLCTNVVEAGIPKLVASCEIDHTVLPSQAYRGGAQEGQRRLRRFLRGRLRRYANDHNEPSAQATSGLSPYLHFGHLSSLEVAMAAKDYADEHKLMADDFLEELIVRRELAFNFACFVQNFTLDCLPGWVQQTLAKHDQDPRDRIYSRDEFEQARTHDPLWNAAQKELLASGKIHGYYRMYWGKKIIEWSPNHAEALDTMLYLNDRFALDGRDPSGYTNILWCFGLHDRPWGERPVFGTIRYMSYDGMRRKTDVDSYIRAIERLA